MGFILQHFFILTLFLAPSSWGQESIYGRQCAETNPTTRQCARYHTCRAPQEGERRSIECLCYKSWADIYPELWKQLVARTDLPDYRSVGFGSSDDLARQDAKFACGALFDSFVLEFVTDPGSSISTYEVADEYCTQGFVCEP